MAVRKSWTGIAWCFSTQPLGLLRLNSNVAEPVYSPTGSISIWQSPESGASLCTLGKPTRPPDTADGPSTVLTSRNPLRRGAKDRAAASQRGVRIDRPDWLMAAVFHGESTGNVECCGLARHLDHNEQERAIDGGA